MTRTRHTTRGRWPWILTLALAACAGGPERTPHQPIKGVDTEKNEVDNPNDREPGPAAAAVHAAPTPMAESEAPSTDSRLARFADELAQAQQQDPGWIVVFPALSTNPTSRETEVTGLGEYLMQETADRLTTAGASDVIAGPRLIRELHDANRGLDALQDVEDVYTLAERLGASYVVFGTADVRDFNRLENDRSLEVRWNSLRLTNLATVSEFRARLAGDEGRQLYRYHQTPSDWKVGARARTFRPALEAEARILGRILAQKLVREQSTALHDRRVRVEPMTLTGRSGARAKLQEWAAEFERKLADVTHTLEADGETTEAEQRALSSVPVTIQGQDFATFGDATDAFRKLRNATEASAAGDLARDLSTSLSEYLRTALSGHVAFVADDAERETLVHIIRREARAARADDTVDAATVARMRAHGTEFVITSSLRLDLDTYKLRVTMLDLSSAEAVPYSIDFDPRFNSALDQALNR